MTKKLIKKIENLTLTATEIEEIIDSVNVTDEIVDFISTKYNDKIEHDESFCHIRDIIKLVDLSKYDEKDIGLSEAAKRSFCSLMTVGKLSRLEIIYFIKNNIATDDDVCNSLNVFPSKDLIEIVLRWRPYLFETLLCRYCVQYGITTHVIENMKQRALKLEKFKFLSQ